MSVMGEGKSSSPPGRQDFLDDRKSHWENVHSIDRKTGSGYHQLVRGVYRHIVPAGLRVLEVGCAQGD